MSTTQTPLDDWVFPADDSDASDPEPDEPDCGHLDVYQTPEGCLRCDDPRQRAQERDAERDLVRSDNHGTVSYDD